MSKYRNRGGFTLVELLIVIVIISILATLAFAVFRSNSTDKLRSAARTAQSAFLGAKDRALHAKDLRGIRLTRDTNGPSFLVAGVSNGIPSTVNGFVYLQPLPLQTTGNIPGQPNQNNVTVTRPNLSSGNTDATQILISGAQGLTWYQQDQNGIWPPTALQVRIPAQTGQWMNLTRLQNTPPYWGTMNGGNLQLTLQVPYQGGNPPPAPNAIDNFTSNASIDIQLGNDVLPFHQPIPLSSGVVVDLQFSSSNVQTLAGASLSSGSPAPNVDFMFSPRGAVSGYLSGLGPLHFLLRDLKDATATSGYTMNDAGGNPVPCGGLIVGADLRAGAANQWGTTDPNKSDRLVLTVFPQTGLVQVFEIDPTDTLNNATGAAGADGLADNIFYFAQQGKSAGR